MKSNIIEKKIINLYKKFFRKFKINKKSGNFLPESRWSFLKFPTYPLIGSKYSQDKNKRVLFIGLEIGRDEKPNEIMGFDEKRKLIENKNKQSPHVYGMGVITIFLLKNIFTKQELDQLCRHKTYKETFNFAKKIKPNFNPLSHIAMTNCYKFVTKERESRLGSKDIKHISIDAECNLLIDEIKILCPKYLVFESKSFIKDKWFKPLLSEIKKKNKNTNIYI